MARIGINLSGGDNGSSVIQNGIEMLPDKIKPIIITYGKAEEREELKAALSDLQSGEIQALMTLSNSKLLLAMTKQYLEIPRPGLIAPFPCSIPNQYVYVVDVGATAKTNDPEVFLGWANAGARFLKERLGIENPMIGLANIAAERACPEISQLDSVLRDKIARYKGYIEPQDFFRGEVHLLLIDGWGGNWTLKTVEFFGGIFMMSILLGLVDYPEARKKAQKIILSRFCYDAYLVSPLVGLKGNGQVFRMHGAATASQVAKGLEMVATGYQL